MLAPRGWRLSPAYDIVPSRARSQEHRDLAMAAGKWGRLASLEMGGAVDDCQAAEKAFVYPGFEIWRESAVEARHHRG